jgi:hypothetical protein
MTNTVKFFFFALMAAVCCACDPNGVGDPSLIEGGWDLRTIDYDKMVYADYSGNTHLKDSAYTRVFEDKEQVWLFIKVTLANGSILNRTEKVIGQAMLATVTAITEPKAQERTSPSLKRAGVLFRGWKNM